MKKNDVTANGRAMPSKTKRVPKRKAPLVLATCQETMFNEGGYQHFNADTDANLIEGLPGGYMVVGMQLNLNPPPRNKSKALGLTVDSLTRLHFARAAWRYIHPMTLKPMTLDSWKCKTCVVTFRRGIDDGVIRATYSSPDKLELSLPHMLMWKTCGLNWLGDDHDCCRRNESNPTPWLGRSCGCP